jgi:hypothetical protein
MDLNRQYSKASKYIATVELEFKGEDLDYVKLLMKDSFLAGIKEVQSLPINSVFVKPSCDNLEIDLGDKNCIHCGIHISEHKKT